MPDWKSLRWLIPFVALPVGASLVPLPLRGVEAEPRPVAVVDLHVDLPYQVNYRKKSLSTGTGQFVAATLAKSGVVGAVLPLYVPRWVSPTGPRTSDLIASHQRFSSLLGATEPYAPPGCTAANGRVRTWFAFEGAGPLASSPDSVEKWVERGVRLFGLVHARDNALATSSGRGGPAATGLTEAGREVVRRVHEAGAVIDVSHASDRATDEIIEMALADGSPVVASHSNARALAPHPRNLTDSQIRAIARTGGVIGINFHSRFLVSRGTATLADVVRHIRHVVDLAGVDHVAIGSDFEGGISPPAELRTVNGFPRLADALRASGLSRGSVEKIFARNALRVLCPSSEAGT